MQMHVRWRIVLILGLLVFTMLLLWGFLAVMVADGAYDLAVTLRRTGVPPVRQAAYFMPLRDDEVRSVVDDWSGYESSFQPVREFTGQRFEVRVPFSEHISALGIRYSWCQYHDLGLLLEFEDGTWGLVTTTIPDGRRSRAITVEINPQNVAKVPVTTQPRERR